MVYTVLFYMSTMGLKQVEKICRSFIIIIYWASVMYQHMLGDSKMYKEWVLSSRSDYLTREIRLTSRNPSQKIYIYIFI